jgi:hypothetical protein
VLANLGHIEERRGWGNAQIHIAIFLSRYCRFATLAHQRKTAHARLIFNERKGGDPMSNEVSALVQGFGIVVVEMGQPSS